MHILFLTTRLPFPPVGGERLRPFYFIKYLSQKHKITLLSFIERKEELDVLRDYESKSIEIETVYLPRLYSYLNCLSGLILSLPLQISYYASRRMSDLIHQRIGQKKIDLVFCHLVRMADYLKDIRVKKVLDLSDALSLRYCFSSRYRKGIFRLIETLEYKRLKGYEPKIASYFDLNLVASKIDQRYFENELNIHNLYCLPNGVEIEEGYRNLKFDPKKIVFFANFRAYPNQDAIVYFYKQIFPFIKKELKDIRLSLVGAQIPRYLKDLFRNNKSIELYSDVLDIRPYIQDACVSVAPMRISVGIQNKILQSMALKVPVVATSI
ncbi:MAG: glycosyltransferase, partial [Candidatus Omnitrophica bacterium]|nr:glycosyltransferase [Candidatus Omnitrophota bacterium]